MKAISALTYKIVAYSAIPNFNTDECVDWAVEMVELVYETENLLILAGLIKPTNYFENVHYLQHAISELNLQVKTGDEGIISYSSYYVREIAQSIKIKVNLNALSNYVVAVDYHPSIYDFYSLYQAWNELTDLGEQWYWDGATTDNIEEIVRNTANQWLVKNERYYRQTID